MKTLGKKKSTSRGFERIEFQDAYGESCSIQQSSAFDPHIWLGQEHETIHHLTKAPIGARMHLNKKQVKALIIHLQKWLRTNTL